jgi:hypothetical protein
MTQNLDSPGIPSTLLGVDAKIWDLSCYWEEEYKF